MYILFLLGECKWWRRRGSSVPLGVMLGGTRSLLGGGGVWGGRGRSLARLLHTLPHVSRTPCAAGNVVMQMGGKPLISLAPAFLQESVDKHTFNMYLGACG